LVDYKDDWWKNTIISRPHLDGIINSGKDNEEFPDVIWYFFVNGIPNQFCWRSIDFKGKFYDLMTDLFDEKEISKPLDHPFDIWHSIQSDKIKIDWIDTIQGSYYGDSIPDRYHLDSINAEHQERLRKADPEIHKTQIMKVKNSIESNKLHNQIEVGYNAIEYLEIPISTSEFVVVVDVFRCFSIHIQSETDKSSQLQSFFDKDLEIFCTYQNHYNDTCIYNHNNTKFTRNNKSIIVTTPMTFVFVQEDLSLQPSWRSDQTLYYVCELRNFREHTEWQSEKFSWYSLKWKNNLISKDYCRFFAFT
jgi:hypothetical protein